MSDSLNVPLMFFGVFLMTVKEAFYKSGTLFIVLWFLIG